MGITRSKVIVHVAVSPPFGAAVAKSVWVISLGGTRLAMHFGSIVGSAKRAARTAALLQLVNNGFHSEPKVERKSDPLQKSHFDHPDPSSSILILSCKTPTADLASYAIHLAPKL